ncbi:MAG: hypothetical protein JWM33_27 [Caulobacteraceae bacterium]|nr:hypothetical protein [Caulobacteraceae bacterium]
MIRHLVAKDFRSLWWLGPTLAIATLGYACSIPLPLGGRSGSFLDAIFLSSYLAAGLAMARVVQLDCPVLPRGDWHTRPIPWGSLLAAKLVVALCILLPWTAIDIGWSLHWGIGLGEAVSGASLHATFLSVLLLLVMAVAAATRSLIPFILVIAGLGGAAWFILLQGVLHLLYAVYYSPGLALGLLGLAGLLLIAATLGLYRRRRPLPAAGLIVAATLGVEVAGMLAGVILGSHWPPMIAPASQQVRAVQVATTDPLLERFMQKSFLMPLQPRSTDGAEAWVERASATSSVRGHAPLPVEEASPFRLIAGRPTILLRLVNLEQAQRLDVRLRLLVLRRLDPVTLGNDAKVALPGGGSCWVARSPPGGSMPIPTLNCVSGRPICLEIILQRTGESLYPSFDGKTYQCARTALLTGRYAKTYYINATWGENDRMILTRLLPLGNVDRTLSTGYITPSAAPVLGRPAQAGAAPSPPSSSPPVNAR